MSDNDQEKVASEEAASEVKPAEASPSEGQIPEDESGTNSTENAVAENAVAEDSVAEDSVAEDSVAEDSVAEDSVAEDSVAEGGTPEQESASADEPTSSDETATADASDESDDVTKVNAEVDASLTETDANSTDEQTGEVEAGGTSNEEGDEAASDESHDEPIVIPNLSQIIEGAVLAADKPLSIDHMIQLFPGAEPSRAQVREAIIEIQAGCEDRGFEFKEVASGYRFQVRAEYGEWIGRLWEEKPPRYTRALLETLALIAYKQPITRGDIEDIRGVSVSTNIIRTLLEREWIRVVGHRDVPGRPSIYATTKTFLDYFDLSSLDELPTLSEIKDLDKLNPELDLEVELIEPRTLNLEAASDEIEGTDADDEALDSVTDRVNEISENIKNLFKEPEEDELDAEFEDEEAEARSEGETVESPETAADEVSGAAAHEPSMAEAPEAPAELSDTGDSHEADKESEADQGAELSEPEQNADDPPKQTD